MLESRAPVLQYAPAARHGPTPAPPARSRRHRSPRYACSTGPAHREAVAPDRCTLNSPRTAWERRGLRRGEGRWSWCCALQREHLLAEPLDGDLAILRLDLDADGAATYILRGPDRAATAHVGIDNHHGWCPTHCKT